MSIMSPGMRLDLPVEPVDRVDVQEAIGSRVWLEHDGREPDERNRHPRAGQRQLPARRGLVGRHHEIDTPRHRLAVDVSNGVEHDGNGAAVFTGSQLVWLHADMTRQ
jgi:hypothetical protein